MTPEAPAMVRAKQGGCGFFLEAGVLAFGGQPPLSAAGDFFRNKCSLHIGLVPYKTGGK